MRIGDCGEWRRLEADGWADEQYHLVDGGLVAVRQAGACGGEVMVYGTVPTCAAWAQKSYCLR